MVPRMKAVPVLRPSSLSPALHGVLREAEDAAVGSTVLLRRPARVAEAVRAEPPRRAAAAQSHGPRKRSLSESSNSSSVELKRHRTEKRPAMGEASASGSCPTMFKGLAAIPVSEDLFEGASASFEKAPRRRCFQPSWSLIGTFKTDLHSVVDADPHHDALRWYQQTPNGDFQKMRVPLLSIKDVRVVSGDAQDAGAHWAIVRTSTRPSQIVFGFEKLSDARRMKSALEDSRVS
ncbi:hypothetical protein DQ04_04711030 [Trypanosoma grayi]|uniref:hypothetical protein n=1 Tax=Trypanosoma grayi TaxID=71804 RepID=UPI0004F4AFC5|nr:hypothetical protein DQ04_04711030 [Trypanosoma grayi]KEG09750.1 hypothetical protein DQ04_04711030 [Trypanosoma grayi]